MQRTLSKGQMSDIAKESSNFVRAFFWICPNAAYLIQRSNMIADGHKSHYCKGEINALT